MCHSMWRMGRHRAEQMTTMMARAEIGRRRGLFIVLNDLCPVFSGAGWPWLVGK